MIRRRATRHALGLALTLCAALPASAEEAGRVGVDWVGNDIVIEAVADPGVKGVTCYLSYFDRSLYDKVTQGNWFENPSNSAISCVATGPVQIGDIARGPKGEQIFREGRSLILKSLKVTRIYDEKNGVLIYLAHATEVTQGSAKMAISVVPVGP